MDRSQSNRAATSIRGLLRSDEFSLIPLAPAIGAVAGGIGILVMPSSAVVERLFRQTSLPVCIRPAIGGLCVGLIAIFTRQVLAAGHCAMLLHMHREMATGEIVMIIVLKLTACLISLASGFRGGLFFVSLFIGCLLSKVFSSLLAGAGGRSNGRVVR